MAQFNVHRHVKGWMKSLIDSPSKEVSTGAVVGQIQLALSSGPFNNWQGMDCIAILNQLENNGKIRIPGRMYDVLHHVLRQGGEAHAAARDLQFELENLPQEIRYDEFERSFIRMYVTSDIEEARNILSGFKGASSNPVYIDTEGSCARLNYGGRTALLSLFDVRTRQVLLWRIDLITRAEVSQVLGIIQEVGETREFAAFGREEFLNGFHVTNLQTDGQQSLKAAAAKVGATISNTETMSNWCCRHLRRDQQAYAAMDAVVLHYIRVGRRIDWAKTKRERHVETFLIPEHEVEDTDELLNLEELNPRNLGRYIGVVNDNSSDNAKLGLQFLAKYGFIANSQVCKHCGNPFLERMVLSHDKTVKHDQFVWRCRDCRRMHAGESRISMRAGTFFENKKFTIQKLIYMAADWIENPTKPVKDTMAHFTMSKQSVVDLQEDFRRMTEQWFIRESQNHLKLGGPNKVVEIDETLVVRAKYNRGRNLRRKQIWVFGLMERGSKKTIMCRVPRRDAATLLPIIEQYVEDGTYIMSDGWAAYGGIAALGRRYRHGVVNHKYHFVDPTDPRIHTQSIEATWNAFKSKLRNRFGTPEDRLGGHMFNYMWRRYFDNHKLLNRLLIEMKTYRREDRDAMYFSDSDDDSHEDSSDSSNSDDTSSLDDDTQPHDGSSTDDSANSDDGIYVQEKNKSKKINFNENLSDDYAEDEEEDFDDEEIEFEDEQEDDYTDSGSSTDDTSEQEMISAHRYGRPRLPPRGIRKNDVIRNGNQPGVSLAHLFGTSRRRGSSTGRATARGRGSSTGRATARGRGSSTGRATARGRGSSTGRATARGRGSPTGRATARGQGSPTGGATEIGQGSPTGGATEIGQGSPTGRAISRRRGSSPARTTSRGRGSAAIRSTSRRRGSSPARTAFRGRGSAAVQNTSRLRGSSAVRATVPHRGTSSDRATARPGIAALGRRYRHGVVNHKYHFVDPTDPRIHTQSIEATWNAFKSKLRNRFGTPEDRLGGHMFNYMWRRYFDNHKLLNRLLIEMKTYRREDRDAMYFSDSDDDSHEDSSDSSNSDDTSSLDDDTQPHDGSSTDDSANSDDGIYVQEKNKSKKINFNENLSDDYAEDEEEDFDDEEIEFEDEQEDDYTDSGSSTDDTSEQEMISAHRYGRPRLPPRGIRKNDVIRNGNQPGVSLAHLFGTSRRRGSSTGRATARGRGSSTGRATARGRGSSTGRATARGRGSSTGRATARGRGSPTGRATARGQGSPTGGATEIGQGSPTGGATEIGQGSPTGRAISRRRGSSPARTTSRGRGSAAIRSTSRRRGSSPARTAFRGRGSAAVQNTSRLRGSSAVRATVPHRGTSSDRATARPRGSSLARTTSRRGGSSEARSTSRGRGSPAVRGTSRGRPSRKSSKKNG